MEKDVPCKWKQKGSWCSNTQTDIIGFKTKTVTKDKRRALHNDKG